MFKNKLKIYSLLLSYALLGLFSTARGQTFQPSQDINLREVIFANYQDRLWVVDPSTLDFSLLFEPKFADHQSLGDVIVSPSSGDIYLIVLDIKLGQPLVDLDEEYFKTLHQLDLASGEVSEILRDTNLARISAVSDTGQMEMFFSNLSEPESSYYCFFDTNTGNCNPLERGFNENTFVWISSNEFVALSNGVTKFTTDGETLNEQLLSPDNAFTPSFAVTSDLKQVFMIVAFQEEDYKQKLAVYNIDTDQYRELDYELSDVHASIGFMRVSPDNQFLAYRIGWQLNLLDLTTGATLFQHENVRQFVWTPDNHSIIATVETLGDPLRLVRIDVTSGEIVESIQLDGTARLITAYGSQ